MCSSDIIINEQPLDRSIIHVGSCTIDNNVDLDEILITSDLIINGCCTATKVTVHGRLTVSKKGKLVAKNRLQVSSLSVFGFLEAKSFNFFSDNSIDLSNDDEIKIGGTDSDDD